MEKYIISYIGTNASGSHVFSLHQGNMANELDYFTLTQNGCVGTDLTRNFQRFLGNEEAGENFTSYINFIKEYGDKSCLDYLLAGMNIYIIYTATINSAHRYRLYVKGNHVDTFELHHSTGAIAMFLEEEWAEIFKMERSNFNDYMWLLSRCLVREKPKRKKDVYTLELQCQTAGLMDYNLLCNGEKVDSFQIGHNSMSVFCKLDDQYADMFHVKTYLEYVRLIVNLSEKGEDE